MTLRIAIQCDAAPAEEVVRSLLEHLADFPLEILDRFVRRFDAIAQPFCVDVDQLAAAGTGNVRIVLQPSQLLLELVGALWAGELDVG